ncbi:MAG: nuclear transport factor 2 family protein [Planctomycetota bacterium]
MPNDVVAKRFAAHNAHELEQFLSCYSSEIQVYDYPDQPIGRQGKDHIRSIFEPLFNDKAVKTTVHQQIVKGSFVIIEETVVRRGETYEYVSIYEVEDGLIKTVRFIKG